jgi:hypothetical protein
VKNLLLYSLLALLLAPGAVATDSPATSDDQGIATSSACSDSRYSLDDLNAEDLAAWLDRIGAESFDPDPAERMSVPACPDIRLCTSPCQLGEGPCFIKPLGTTECCGEDDCIRCEEGTEIFVTTCPCLGKGCPRTTLELSCD